MTRSTKSVRRENEGREARRIFAISDMAPRDGRFRAERGPEGARFEGDEHRLELSLGVETLELEHLRGTLGRRLGPKAEERDGKRPSRAGVPERGSLAGAGRARGRRRWLTR